MTSHRDSATTSTAYRAFADLCQSRSWAEITPNDLAECPPGLRSALGILQYSPSPMFCVWGQDRTLFYNDASASLFQTQASVVNNGQSLYAMVEERGAAILRCTERVLTTGQPLGPAKCKDNCSAELGESPIAWSYSPLWNDAGAVEGVFASGSPALTGPATHRAIAVDGQTSTSFFGALDLHQVTDHLPVLMALIDQQQRYRFVNQTYADWFGLPTTTIQGQTVEQVLGERAYRTLSPYIEQALAGQTVTFERRLNHSPGKTRHVEATYVPQWDAVGNVIGFVALVIDINERKQTEIALQDQHNILETILRQAGDAIMVCDADGHLTFVNREARRLAQLDPEGTALDIDLLAWGTAYDIEGKAIPLERYCIAKALRGEATSGYESRMVRQDGSYYDILISAAPLWNDHYQIVGAVASFVDITKRKRAEQALRQSEDRLRMAIESAQLGVWDWNLLTNELNWDAGCRGMFGLSEDVEVTIDTFFAGLHPDDHDRLVQVVQECLDPTTGGNYDVEFRALGLEDGLERWILAKGQVYFAADQTPLRFTGTVLDITNQKHYEQALMTSEAIARARAEELTAIMETTPAAIWIAHDPQCHTMTANKTAYDLMGLELGSVITATPASNVEPLPFKRCRHGQEVAPHDLPMQKAIGTERVITDEIDFVFSDGTMRTIYGKAVPLFGPDNRVRGAIGGFVDITALKQSKQQRERLLQLERQARKEAENASRIKDEFLAILSHELRSPLNPILGWVTLLRRGQLSETKTATALETIERNARLQIQLIDDLLDVSRIIRGKLSVNMVPTSLGPTIQAAIETVRLAAEAKHISITTHFSSEVGPILGDSARLQQVIWNLLSNAIKFTPEGGRVEVWLEQVSEVGGVSGVGEVGEVGENLIPPSTHPPISPSQYAQITVTDTGRGISPEFLPHVFDYFRQADSSTTRAFGGLGLGLAIVRYLVELHGGTVQASSPGDGQGSTFSVRFPLYRGNS